MAKRKQYDWEAIEREYRLGQKSMRTLADEFGPNVSNISRRAKKEGWVQDKSEEVRQRTNATLIAQQQRNTPTQEDIKRAVETNVQVVREHRKDISNGMKMVALLTSQLRDAAESRAELEDQIFDDTAASGDDEKDDIRRRNAMLKAVSLPSHASVLRDLSTALKNLIPLERQAFAIDESFGRDFGKGVGEGLKGSITNFPPEIKSIEDWLAQKAKMERGD